MRIADLLDDAKTLVAMEVCPIYFCGLARLNFS
jgi:hypothetical protein